MDRIPVLAIVLGLLASCAASKPPTLGDYYASSDYQDRELLQHSLFRSDQDVLSTEEIERILSARIELPNEAHLAVLRLGASDEALAWAFLQGDDHPLATVEQIQRIARLSWLPSLMVPNKRTVPLLREAAARETRRAEPSRRSLVTEEVDAPG